MSAIGKIGSFATDKPINDTIGDALKYTDQVAFRNRQEDAKDKALKKAEDDAKLKDYAEWDGKFDPKIIGNSSIDDPLIGMAMKAKQRAADISRELYNTTDFNKKAALMSERAKLAQSFDIANQTPVLIKQKVKDLQEGIEKGKYNPRDVDFVEKLSKNFETGKYELNYNDRGVATVKIYDTDENGKPIGVLKETTLGDLVNAFQPKLAFSYEKYKDDTLKNVKPDEFGTQKGAVIIEGKKISPKNVEQSKTYADVIINDPNKLYEAQFLFKENDPEKLRFKLEKDFLTSIPEGQTQKLDARILNYNLAKKKSEEEEIKLKTFDFNNYRTDDFLEKGQDGQIVSPYTVYRKGVSFSKPVEIVNLGGQNSDLNMVKVLGYTKDRKTGDLIFTGKALKTKNAKFTVGGETFDFPTVSDMANKGNKEAKAALASYTAAPNYGNFTRRIADEDEANAVLAQAKLDVNSADAKIEELNKGIKQFEGTRKVNTQDDFNAKWSKLKPGETLVGPDGQTYKKKQE